MDVESAADLYGLEPVAFVAARDALAKALRTAGDKDEATRVKALRRPSVAAWALNMAARADGALVDELLDAADAARRAHDQVLGGASGDVLRDALARRRDATNALAQRARAALEEAGRPADAQQRDIDALLDHAVDSPEAGAALRAGALTGALDREGDAEDLLARLAASVTDRPSTPPARQAAAARLSTKAKATTAAASAGKAAAQTGRSIGASKELLAARKERDRRQAAVAAAERAATAADRSVGDAATALAAASAAHTAAVTEREARSRALADANAALADAERRVADLES